MIALGLHLELSEQIIDHAGRQRRARIFYSIYNLEVLLAEVLGRPKSISLDDVTVSTSHLANMVEDVPVIEGPGLEYLPNRIRRLWSEFLDVNKNSPQTTSSGSDSWRGYHQFIGKGVFPGYFSYRTRLCMISHRISSTLYLGVHRLSWSDVQRETDRFELEMRKWHESLPPELDIHNANPTDYDPQHKTEIAMYYHSVRMILYRPFVDDIYITDQSDSSRSFNYYAGRSCVFAAIDLLALLPNNLETDQAYHQVAWWSLLHYLCQAAAMLTLELSLNVPHFGRADTRIVIRYLEKSILYLRYLAEGSLSAYKAWRIFQRLSTDLNSRCGVDDIIIPEDIRPPYGWSDEDELWLAKVGV